MVRAEYGVKLSPVGYPGKGDVEEVLVAQHLVHKVVHMAQAEVPLLGPQAHPPIVDVQGLQILEHLRGLAHKPQVERSCSRGMGMSEKGEGGNTNKKVWTVDHFALVSVGSQGSRAIGYHRRHGQI